jgi:hypothetical protein
MGANALFVLPASGAIKFSQVRDMYDQGNGSLSDYYRSTDTNGIVNSDTYHTSVNPFINTAENIGTTGTPLKLSQFRGAFKEHRVTVGTVAAPYNIDSTTVDTAEKRTYRFYVTGYVHQSASAWDSSGNGKSGMVVNVTGSNTRVIVHVVSGGKIGGGPGQGGGGGYAGQGGTGGTAGSGSSQNGVAGGNADCNVSSNGNDGDIGSGGKRGGHCIEILDYPVQDPFHIHKDDVDCLIPGGGGGGGAGGGGGGGAGETGGGGGHGAQGYNSSSLTKYHQSYPGQYYFWRGADSFNNNTYRWQVRWNDTIIYSTEYTYGSGALASVVYNGVTYNKGASAPDTQYGNDPDYDWWEITNTDYRTYFNGGPGGQGKSGVTGEPGRTGPAGGRGGYLNNVGAITAASTGYTAWGDKNDTSGSAGTSMYGSPSAIAYNGSCNGGFGGQGGGSGGGGGGGGYAAGGAGGAAVATGSSAGSVGGGGRNGRDGLATVFYTAQSGFDNGCGGGGASYGGAGCQKTSGGDGQGGGGGGAAGSFYVKAAGITVSSN